MQDRFTKWLLFAPLGLTLIGLGMSVTTDATLRKGAGKSWFWRGTLGLCILNAGSAVFGDAVKERALLDWEQRS